MSAYLWYGLMRPDIFAWVENKYPVSLLFGVTSVLSSLAGGVADLHRCLISNPLVRMLFLLQIPISLSVLFAVDRDLSVPRYLFYIRVIMVLIFLPLAIRTEQFMRLAFLTIALSLGFLGVKFGLYGIVAGGADLTRSGFGEMFADNNFLALGLATNLAICWYGRAVTSSPILKVILLGMFGCSISGIVMFNSRGGVIAATICLLILVFRSKSKTIALVVVLGMMAGSIYLVENMFFHRMGTLTQEDPDASAESRLEHAKVAVRMWKDHPILGVGFGGLNYGNLVPLYSNIGNLTQHVAHNSYLQVLVDSGFAAFLLYVGELGYAIVWLGNTGKRLKKEKAPESAVAVTYGLQTSLITFAIGSTFYSANRIDLLYILLMMTAAWYAILKQQAETETAVPVQAQAPAIRFTPAIRQVPRSITPGSASFGPREN